MRRQPGRGDAVARVSRRSFLLVVCLLFLTNIVNAFPYVEGQTDTAPNRSSGPDPLLMLVSSERIRIQVDLAQQNFESGEIDAALSHIYIPLSVTFQSVKQELKSYIGEEKTSELEATLADIPTSMRAGDTKSLDQQFKRAGQILDEIRAEAEEDSSIRNGLISQTVVVLLRDAEQFYQERDSPLNLASAHATVIRAELNYQMIAGSLSEGRRQEINEFFAELKAVIPQKIDAQRVSQLISSIQRDLDESAELSSGSQTSSEHIKYFVNIDSLYDQLLVEVKSGNYQEADALAVTAYLDNFEYLETPLEKAGQLELMLELEDMMRIELREKIKAEEDLALIESFVNNIRAKLETARGYLVSESDAFGSTQPVIPGSPASTSAPTVDIEKLKEGFGTYQGEFEDIGGAEESEKSQVRSNIDEIRTGLDQTLQLYRQGNFEAALLSARTAYLDNYEFIEIPLRPIDPDFTLDMEIKFGELRNLIQTRAPYSEVEGKVIEIRRGLDESERLVSGPGVMAPAIAFSTSFSLVFREGLESALIVGAILTYLEASRNNRFKKHVYYGIMVAIGATAVTWFVAQFVIEISGASKELIEAIAGVSAVAVLFWVSFWVLNKVETKKWIEFVKAKVWQATTTGSAMVFVMLSFFTVYREGFETVLFYQAMLSFAKYMEWYVVAGLVLGLVTIIGVALVVRKLGKRLPLRALFGLTMGVGAYMSIAFMGNAIREFQEVGYLPITSLIGTVPRLDINLATMTGIHPTLETVVAQMALLAVYVAGSTYVLFLRPRREKEIQMARKSHSDITKRESDQL